MRKLKLCPKIKKNTLLHISKGHNSGTPFFRDLKIKFYLYFINLNANYKY